MSSKPPVATRSQGNAPPAREASSTPNLDVGLAPTLREHLGVCNALLELAHKESEALRSPAPFPVLAMQVERKALLSRLDSVLKLLVRRRNLWQKSGKDSVAHNPQVARLLQTALDTIMRVLVLDRENEQQLLRRGLVPVRALPPAQQSQPHYVARLYQRHTQT